MCKTERLPLLHWVDNEFSCLLKIKLGEARDHRQSLRIIKLAFVVLVLEDQTDWQ